MKVLGSIDFGSNELAGAIPSELGNTSSTMYHMDLDNNRLSSTLPTELGALTALEDFRLSNNMLTGTLPTEIGRLMQLGLFRLNDNRFSGSIPSQIGLWGANTTEIEYEDPFNHTFGTSD